MISLDPAIIAIILFVSCLTVLVAGLPVAFTLGGVSVIFVVLFMGWDKLPIIAGSAFSLMTQIVLVAVPLFIFMAEILRGSGIAEALFVSVRRIFGGTPGGLAMGVILICTLIAAMSGVAAAGVLTMGILALPIMLRLGYDKTMAIGPVMAGGSLGILIPPSVSFVFYGALAKISVGRLFAGGMIPGLTLALLYMVYIGIRCRLKPELGPPLPPEERVGWKEKITSLRGVVLPMLLIAAVLGAIFLGMASPTEASAVGAAGAVVCAAVYRRLNWQMILDALVVTAKVTGMCAWILVGGLCFRYIFMYTGGAQVIGGLILGLEIAPLLIIFMMQLIYMVLGCFMDEITIMFVSFPVFLPVVASLGYDPIWFGVLFLINLQIAYLTPPFGYSLFYMRSVAPPGITIIDIYRSIIPFIPIQVAVIALVMFFPQLALWLPNLMIGK